MADGATVGALRQAIHDKLNIPLEDIVLSKDPALVGHRSACSPCWRRGRSPHLAAPPARPLPRS